MSGLSPGGWLRLMLLCATTLALLPVQFVAVRLGARIRPLVPMLYHRIVCRCLGIRRVVRGLPPPSGAGGLVVVNHVSWTDIAVLGALRPLAFVAKAEVETWPGVGLLARLQRTVFIDRTRRAATAEVAATMGARLADGEMVVLFAEGTTGDGTRILPMRSSLLGAAHAALGPGEADVTVHPLTITYTRIHGLPAGRSGRARLAWYGDTELAPHLAQLLRLGAIEVELAWGEPFAMGRAISRKQATARAEIAIRRARQDAVTGRS